MNCFLKMDSLVADAPTTTPYFPDKNADLQTHAMETADVGCEMVVTTSARSDGFAASFHTAPFEKPEPRLVSGVQNFHKKVALFLQDEHLQSIQSHILQEATNALKKTEALLRLGPSLHNDLTPQPASKFKANEKLKTQPNLKRKLKSKTAVLKKKKTLAKVI